MEYTKIRVSSRDDAKRFYRVLAVKGDPDLYLLGAVIGESIGAWFEHFYLFRANKRSYVADSWLEDWPDKDDISMGKAHLSDLGERFIYEYDTGEGWEFDCRVLKRKLNYHDEELSEEEYPLAFVIEGKGQGIFENAHDVLWRYLDGEIDPESSEEDEETFTFLPMNLSFEKYGDFDKPLDIEEMVYDEWRAKEVADHFRNVEKIYPDDDDLSFSSDEDDEEDEEDALIYTYEAMRFTVAGLIFHDDEVNAVFRRLLKTYDLNDAYDKICDLFISICDDPQADEEELFAKFFKKVKKLK